ncbi:myosin light chain 1 isoform X1 [Zerene cesonia]|uniref:myosin light chain 1 isoform X1 n=1 Tax=Zerene cesonia TaxID=33412 RepID=UPI0018E532E8|nr:myosin light chain 1 isoform X1 [Zerene cesonia]
MSDLSKNDIERASFAFSIYDFTGNGKIDAYNLGDVLRALNSNPTLATIEKLGGTKKKGEKQLSVEEFLPIYAQCKKDKDQGVYEDFLECLKLYDKNENGLMLAAELTHTLLALGEKLNDEEVAEITKDCMDPEDDDGMIPYASFLKKMVEGWSPKKTEGAAAPAEAPAQG